MRNLLFFALLFCPTLITANIDFPTLKGVHAVYKPEYKDYSLIYSEIAKETFLEGVRIRGNFGQRNSDFYPHPQLTPEQRRVDWPNDPVARLIQHIYPSPTRDELTPAPEREKDLVGRLDVGTVGRIVNYLSTHKKDFDCDELTGVIWGPAEFVEKNKKALAKLLRGNVDFWQRRLAKMIASAHWFQEETELYPELTLPHAFSALIFWKAENKEDVKDFLRAMPDLVDSEELAKLDDSEYTKEDWEKAKAEMLKKPLSFIQNDIERATLAEACEGYLNKAAIPGVRQGYATFKKTKFANCGETALNWLFNFFIFNTKTGLFDLKRVREIEKTHKLNISPLLYELYTLAPSGLEMRKKFVLNHWAKIVSGLPDVRYNKGSKETGCDIQSRFSNHAFVIGHVLGDQDLLDLAKALRQESDRLFKESLAQNDAQKSSNDEKAYQELCAKFWNRLVFIFSDKEDHDGDDNSSDGLLFEWEEVSHDSNKQYTPNKDLLIVTLSRSDLPESLAEFRVLGTHGKFIMNNETDDEVEGVEFPTDLEDLEHIQTPLGCAQHAYFSWLTSLNNFLDEIKPHLTHFHTQYNEGSALTNFFKDKKCFANFAFSLEETEAGTIKTLLELCLENGFEEYECLFRESIRAETETSHFYGLERFAPLAAKYPESFLKNYEILPALLKCMELLKNSSRPEDLSDFEYNCYSLTRYACRSGSYAFFTFLKENKLLNPKWGGLLQDHKERREAWFTLQPDFEKFAKDPAFKTVLLKNFELLLSSITTINCTVPLPSHKATFLTYSDRTLYKWMKLYEENLDEIIGKLLPILGDTSNFSNSNEDKSTLPSYIRQLRYQANLFMPDDLSAENHAIANEQKTLIEVFLSLNKIRKKLDKIADFGEYIYRKYLQDKSE